MVSFNFCNNYFTYQTSGTGQQTTHTFPGPGTYYVSLISTDTTGCTAISDQIIVVSGGTFNQIYGQVYAGNFPVLQGYVLLFSDNVNPSQNSYFSVTPIILAVPFNVSGYLPTYYGDVIDWESAYSWCGRK